MAAWRYLRELYEMGRSDKRKVVFAAKMAVCLAAITTAVLLKEQVKNSIWAILTVVVVFEFSVGATLSKGLNRALGTLTAGGLALGVAEVAVHSGRLEGAVMVSSVLVAGFGASYAKLHPAARPYEYGFRVFLLTYCIVLVSGTKSFLETASNPRLLLAHGGASARVVNILVFPIWSGEDLHKLVVNNFRGLATSLQGKPS